MSDIRFEFSCTDGSRAMAQSASLALLYWYGRLIPPPKMEDLDPHEVHVIKQEMPAPYNSIFMSLVIAGIERQFGKAPEIPEELLEENWYDFLKKEKDSDDAKKIRQEKFKVYEQTCVDILKWLETNGDIDELYVN